MKVRSAVSFMALGAGSVLAYQQVKNGNFDKMMKKFKNGPRGMNFPFA